MTSLGDVYLDVHADTKGLKREVRKGAKGLGREGDVAGQEFSGGFDRGFSRDRRRSGVFRSMFRLLGAPFRMAIKGFGEVGKSMKNAFTQAAEGTSTMARMGMTFSVLGAGLLATVAPLALMAGGFAAILLLVGPLVAALSMLVGVVVALAGTIAFALVGAVGALAAVIAPLIAGVGVLGLAFIGMSDKAKKAVKEAFKPLVAEFKKLGAAARGPLLKALPGIVKNLQGPLKNLEPLVRRISRAIGDVGLGFAKGLKTKGFKDFRDSMEKFLPFAIRRLGNIARQTLGGLGGIFRGMVPFMKDVLRWLDNLTGGFSKWANSAKGQSQIKAFFEDVKVSVKALGGFLKEVGGLIGDLFSAGKGSGDSMFTSMEDAVKRLRKFLKDNPDALKDWFESAKRFGEKLGDLAVSAGKLMDALDSKANREIIIGTFDALATAIDGLSTAIDILNGKSVDFGSILGGGGGGGKEGGFKLPDIATWGANVGAMGLPMVVLKGQIDGVVTSLKGFVSKKINLVIERNDWGWVTRLKNTWDGIKSKAATLTTKRAGQWGALQRLRDLWHGIKTKAATLKANRGGNWGALQKLSDLWKGIKTKAATLKAKRGGDWGALQKLKGLWDSIKTKTVTIWKRIRGAGWGIAEGGPVAGFASGGKIPGTGPADKRVDDRLGMLNGRPIGLRSGEFVVNEPATRRFLPLLTALNNAGRMAAGGSVNLPGRATGGPAPVVNVDTDKMTDAQMQRLAYLIGEALAKRLGNRDSKNIRLMALGAN